MKPFVIRLIGLCCFAFALLAFTFSYRHTIVFRSIPLSIQDTLSHVDHDGVDSCASPFKLDVGLSYHNYSRGIIRPRFGREKRASLSHIEDHVLLPFGSFAPDLTHDHSDEQKGCLNFATVDVKFDLRDPRTESLLIGMTTPVDRLDMRMNEIGYYLRGSKASLLVVVPGDRDMSKKQEYYRNQGLDITLVSSTVEPFQSRYFSVIRQLSLHISSTRPDTRWVATVDDDTFFPQLSQITARLTSLNHGQYHWVGTLSESSLNVKNFGYFSYGGSGIYLSRALLERMNASYDNCTYPELGGPSLGGDYRITKCINRIEPSVNLTVWNELRQWDLRGPPAGMYESGKPIWTFHHWGGTGWADKDVLSMCATASVAGEDSILRRWMFDRTGGWDISERRSYYVLTNGFSIVRYEIEPGVEDINFDKTEYTWADNPDDYEDFVGPFRKVVVPGITKKRWLLDQADKVGNNTHQLYKYEGHGQKSFIEIVWLGNGSETGNVSY